MIRVRRTPCPPSLKNKPAHGDHYNKTEVVQALWSMQHGKCCYCEQMLPARGHLKAVEHFRPKAVFTGLRNEWTNLLLACAQCNGKKSDKFPTILADKEDTEKVLFLDNEQAAILDPSDLRVDPEDHIDFDFSGAELDDGFGVIMARNESLLGIETISAIGLDGSFYARLRYDRYRTVLLERYIALLNAVAYSDSAQIDIQKDKFVGLMLSGAPFAGFARSFARAKRLDKRIALPIPAG